MKARAVTAAAGDQPASSSGLMNAPDVPNEAAEITAAARPECCGFTANPPSWTKLFMPLTLGSAE
ncbi:hypothetical protein Asi03nite_30290 [Actinoplanes siamensis]|uniref:Uncharacterized protein n=1 Tax=Actinoplanes siamensis TaxID=1223317 RepID=A0A919N708_9ACTN|nr:hypothetical protein Asi03nite_30290 [Actinoplanes siamensis]